MATCAHHRFLGTLCSHGGRVGRGGMGSILGFVAATLMVGAFVSPVAAVNDLSLNVAFGSECVSVGDTVNVTLDIANLTAAINGVDARLQYDSALLTLVDILPTDLGFVPPAAGWLETLQTDTGGSVDYAIIIDNGSVLINHTVATLVFTAIADGTTSISFRPDSPPSFTTLTVAADGSTILPIKFDSGAISIGFPDCTITAAAQVCDGSSGNPASVPNAGAGATYVWTVTGGVIEAGQGTNTITYTATDPTSVTIDVTVVDANGCTKTCQKVVGVIDCTPCLPRGSSCTDDQDCCSGKCKGKAGNKSCKGN